MSQFGKSELIFLSSKQRKINYFLPIHTLHSQLKTMAPWQRFAAKYYVLNAMLLGSYIFARMKWSSEALLEKEKYLGLTRVRCHKISHD